MGLFESKRYYFYTYLSLQVTVQLAVGLENLYYDVAFTLGIGQGKYISQIQIENFEATFPMTGVCFWSLNAVYIYNKCPNASFIYLFLPSYQCIYYPATAVVLYRSSGLMGRLTALHDCMHLTLVSTQLMAWALCTHNSWPGREVLRRRGKQWTLDTLLHMASHHKKICCWQPMQTKESPLV